ncbi:Protein GVP36 [Cyphellophora attinorum]|uniref:Protein GVP36 n=1 Tax=Cyphellophora attinorum TaxID=1664694 RepID=A0A0N1NXB4_9EURO|nr:Protein GVP36 [Phialophora attinorum]KPI37386.1 Protein GVP36 [Phialophora attinorum]
MDKITGFGKNISSAWNSTVTPLAQRNTQYLKETFGSTEEKTALPDEYVDLEKRVDALKLVHQKLLEVTKQYSNEAYDYPPNIRESFGDLGRSITDKVSLLSKASSPAEAQAAFTAPPSAKPQPKTFNHAIARASLASSHLLTENPSTPNQDPLAQASRSMRSQKRKSAKRALRKTNRSKHVSWLFATKARRNVENSRLMLDSTKAAKKSQVQGRGMNPDDETALSEEARAEIEAKEDDFVSQVEEAQGVMKNVLDTPEPLRNLADLIAAQLEYHKKAYEILSELAPEIDQLQVDQEASYRQSREGA